jgi:arabinogalactan endo-1,4-beta-galactosidase
MMNAAKKMLIPLFFVVAVLRPSDGSSRPARPAERDAFLTGADVSMLPQIEDLGGRFRNDGAPGDAIGILKEHGIRCIRLKLWHAPADSYNTLERVLAMARRIREQDLEFLLDFHYSDTWADPGRQTKPAAWTACGIDALEDSVFQYTRRVISALIGQNTRPDMVQIGNEINAGLLWNEGRVGGGFDTPSQWANLGRLLKAGIRGVREAGAGGDSVRILIHYANAANNSGCRWFFDRVFAQGVEFDAIGLSYYPWWHGTLAGVRVNLDDLAGRYGKDVYILETAYPWTLAGADRTGNLIGDSGQLHAGYPATVDGQARFLGDLIGIVRNTRDRRGAGLFYWEPEYISVPPIGSPWENAALFDFSGNALRSMDAFLEAPPDSASVSVTVRLNTATLADTLGENGFVQLRGALNGLAGRRLPDGGAVTWDSGSELILRNTGGDYWEATFPMAPGDTLSYKYWSGFGPTRGTFQRLGWEGPVLPDGGLSGNRRVLVTGQNDTVLAIEYFNSAAEARAQYWRPFENRPDSVALYFRVNMGKASASGRFVPDLNGPVAVRGDAIASGGSLDWNESKLLLRREESSVNDGSFWSGVCYVPAASAIRGSVLEYRFYMENGGVDPWESPAVNRCFVFSGSGADTTLRWAVFDDSGVSNGVEDERAVRPPSDFRLGQNYPNPFNAETRIPFELPDATRVLLTVQDVAGRKVSVLARGWMPAGRHTARWNAERAAAGRPASGIFFVRLETARGAEVRRMVLLK